MKLLVDIGNSRVKWATLDKDGLSPSQSFQRSKTGIKASLNKAWKSLKDIEAVYVANVGGDKLGEQLSEWAEKNWQVTPKTIKSEQRRFGVSNAYGESEKLGIDRWLSLIAARQHARQAQCIIDCGTAMTIDIVTKNGQHQGGMILPGLSLMRSSLASNTDALTEDEGEQEYKTLAANTYSAIQAGTLYSVTATLERIISDLKLSFENKIRFIITGGDAEHLLPLLPDEIHHYPDIVLKGLAFYARQDDKPTRQPKADADSESEPEQTVETTEASSKQPEDVVDTPLEENVDEKPASKPKPRRGRRKKTEAQPEEASVEPDNNDATLPEQAI
jgi:type III pantothenate kinase